MRRLLIAGGVALAFLAIIAWGFLTIFGSRGGSVSIEAVGLAPRVGDDAGYTVRYRNSTAQPITNPQFQTVIRTGEQDWTCQGYQDPGTGAAVVGTDPETQPLTVSTNQDLQVTIYCRIPDTVVLDSAQVVQRP